MVSRFREELRTGPRRRHRRRDHGRDQRQGRHVLRPGRRGRAVRACCCSSRPRCARSASVARSSVAASVFYALTFLPAVLGMLGPRVNSLGVAGAARPRPAALRPAGRRRRGRRPRVALGADGPLGHGPAGRRAHPDARLPAAPRHAVPAPRARASRTRRSCRAGIESREAAVALSRDFRAGETSPIVVLADVDGSPTDAANVQRILDYGARSAAIDGVDRVEGPFAGLKDPATGADARRRRHRRAVRHAARPAAARARGRPRPASRTPTSAARPSASTRSARSRRSARRDRGRPRRPRRRRRRRHDPGRRPRRRRATTS